MRWSATEADAAANAAPFGLWPLFAVFAKIGAVLFGSGYVLLAFLRADLVDVSAGSPRDKCSMPLPWDR